MYERVKYLQECFLSLDRNAVPGWPESDFDDLWDRLFDDPSGLSSDDCNDIELILDSMFMAGM